MEDTIILYPSPGMGHLVPMVELGKLILTHNPSFSIVILITTAPFYTGSTSSYISRVSTTTPSILFHHLPSISPPSTTSSDNIAALAFELPRLYNSNLDHALQTMISQKSRPKASIIDMFCNSSFEVFTSLDIPTYYFCASSASSLSALLSLPKTHQILMEKIKDPDTSIEFPGVPPIPTPDLPGPFLDPEGIAYKSLFSAAINMAKSAGILTNTCHAFEPRAIKAISDGLCNPNLPTPSVYCIGPIVANSGEDHEHECLRWLDSQPSRSVVFLCFGSLGLFKAEQLMEMAIGLEKGGHRFLWVVRSPPADGETKSILAEPDLDVLLPNGFLDRTRGRGLVVKKWAPQVAVLSHDSVGGFVTHCGWNSILEALSAGVPMVAWPLYAEQRLNRVLLVEEMKVALALEESESGFVRADELEKRVGELMDSVSGKGVRERLREMGDCAKSARGDGGSSRVALAELVESWKGG
ncbi:hypothetical protein RHMOL_Rhmol03G0219600 [Rhododendron molle]|uniref:Uncharacterized protein n=1 Tax=Rhododendron molle TaxID=49168 RepID=A0ACC0PHB7_RHOML|nr:hypothetical protein RHMOL_Rhmol03G0219600 [Rhododendron molle]